MLMPMLSPTQVLEYELLSRRTKILSELASQRGASPRVTTVRITFLCKWPIRRRLSASHFVLKARETLVINA
jgi:hypothetical protein